MFAHPFAVPFDEVIKEGMIGSQFFQYCSITLILVNPTTRIHAYGERHHGPCQKVRQTPYSVLFVSMGKGTENLTVVNSYVTSCSRVWVVR
jgi:hypothetical protein